MNSNEWVTKFLVALKRGDDPSAMTLMETDLVAIHSVACFEGIRLLVPLIFLAVQFLREQVVRVLVRRGASIDSFRVMASGESVTPAGESILESNVPALSLCHSLGANLSCVYRTAHSPPKSLSGMEFAIGEAEHAPLSFFLDEIYVARPVCLDENELGSLVALASHGSPAKVCYEILASRGFNFKGLEETKCNSVHGFPVEISAADALLSYAQKSGSVSLLRYIVKDLGLVSSAGRMESLNNIVDADCSQREGYGDGISPPRADLTKYKCAVCDIVAVTSFCSFCKVPRYCSKECQRSHWKTGGHRKECRNIYRRVLSKDDAKEGPSGAAGSSKS